MWLSLIFIFVYIYLTYSQEADSDDEWQGLIDTSDPEGEPEAALSLMKDNVFVGKLKGRLLSSSTQVGALASICLCFLSLDNLNLIEV